MFLFRSDWTPTTGLGHGPAHRGQLSGRRARLPTNHPMKDPTLWQLFWEDGGCSYGALDRLKVRFWRLGTLVFPLTWFLEMSLGWPACELATDSSLGGRHQPACSPREERWTRKLSETIRVGGHRGEGLFGVIGIAHRRRVFAGQGRAYGQRLGKAVTCGDRRQRERNVRQLVAAACLTLPNRRREAATRRTVTMVNWPLAADRALRLCRHRDIEQSNLRSNRSIQ